MKPAARTPTNSPVRTPSREVAAPRSSATATLERTPSLYCCVLSHFSLRRLHHFTLQYPPHAGHGIASIRSSSPPSKKSVEAVARYRRCRAGAVTTAAPQAARPVASERLE